MLAKALIFVLATAPLAHAKTVVVRPGDSIQAAIDAAPAGATIRVEPGTYHESGAARALTVTKDRIRLIGDAQPGRPVVLEASAGQTEGIWVSPDDSLAPVDVELPPCGVSGRRLHGFEVSGFTVEGFGDIGVYLTCVEGFHVTRNVVTDNGRYAIFPVRSARGRIARNTTARTRSDACLYTGQDERLIVDDNQASDCEIGLQIENSRHVRFTHNVATGNTVGMVVDVIDGRQVKVESDNVVTDNVLADNNRPNTAPPGYETAMLPAGIGLVMDAPDRTLVARNRITGNTFVGLTLVNFCIGEPGGVCGPGLDIDPYPDGNRVVQNQFQGNAIDVLYFPASGQGNCFARNQPADLNAAGTTLPACHGRASY